MGSVSRDVMGGCFGPESAFLIAAFDTLPAAVLLACPDGSVRAGNQAFTSITGLAADEVDDAALGAILRDPATAKRGWRGGWLCPRRGREPFPALLTVSPLPSGNGETILIASFDSTARPNLTPWENDFELFFNLIPDLACIAHVDGYFKRVNPAWEKTLGWTPEEVLSRPFLELVHPEDLERTTDEAARQSRDYRTRQFVNRYRAKDGSYRILEWTTTFNRDEHTRFGIARDITAQKQWENSLRESEERFRIMADSCPTIIWVTGADGRMLLTNRTYCQFFGESAGRATSPADEALIHPDDVAEYAGKFAEAVRLRASFRAEARARRADGAWRWIASYANPRMSAQGDYLGHVGISPDITERKEAEQAMRDAKLAAEAANRAKGEFLANMSHEIRTPMSAVIGLTDLTLETELTADQRGYLEAVRSSADSLLRILNDILDFSKVEAGKLEFEAVEFDVRQLIESTLQMVRPRAMAKGLDLSCDIGADVPDRVIGDPARLRQVLVNLTGNAVKFTDRGAVVIRTRLSPQNADGIVELQFAITDTGIGIPEEKRQQIFRPFTQADSSTTRRFGGTGLGLTISAQLVGLMEGRIWVESEVGAGSTFHFTARFATALGNQDGPEPSGTPQETLQVAPMRLLVVEDNAVNRLLATRLLQHHGHDVVAVTNGQEALERIAAETFDCVLMDVQMPVMDGYEATAAIRRRELQEGGSLPVIAMTAHAMAGDLERCIAAGMDGYLTKPVNAVDLLAAIEEARAKHGRR